LSFEAPSVTVECVRFAISAENRARIVPSCKKSSETGTPSPRHCSAHIQDVAAINKGLKMQRRVGFSMAVVAALVLFCQSADAGARRHRHSDDDMRLTAAGIGVGVGSTAAYFALRDWRSHPRPFHGISQGGAFAISTLGCMGVSPIVATIVVQRELTMREAYAMTADCVIPFVGSWLMNKAFDAHPEWEGRKARRRH
jgi:hypothetical protein